MATINLGAIKFNWKGAFNNSTAYAVDDVVSSGGNSYVCIQASQGNAVGNATAYWNIMSTAGTNGSNGTDLSSTLSTRGDLVFKNASALARLAKGTAGQVLGQGANDPAWVNGSSSTLTTQGDILYRNASGLARLAKGTAAQALLMNSAANAPEWGTAAGGKVLQVVHNIFTGTATVTDNNGETSPETPRVLSGLELAITPSSTSSKILLIFSIQGISSNDSYASIHRHTSTQNSASVGTAAQGTQLAVPTSPGNRTPAMSGDMHHRAQASSQNQASILFLDSPSTTSARYYMPTMTAWSNQTFKWNHAHTDTNAGWVARGVSTAIAMEIGA